MGYRNSEGMGALLVRLRLQELLYYQYARPYDKLPSVKRVILRAKREIHGLKNICRPDSG